MAPGDRVVLEVEDAGGGQVTRHTQAGDLQGLNFSRINPVTGPVHVHGARPGDALRVTFEEFRPSGWGWTALIPGFGLLADQFTEPVLATWDYDPEGATAAFGDFARVPLVPFAGTVGLAPAEPGLHSVVPPRRVGGNMDLRDVRAGATLLLPVEVEGGLLSVGDTHGAQGDGEVCGTALESAMSVTVRVELERGRALPGPLLVTADAGVGPGATAAKQCRDAGAWVTTGVGPDLMVGARDAVRWMIDLLGREAGLSPERAYLLCSVAGHLRIGEVVNVPNWLVCCEMPRWALDV